MRASSVAEPVQLLALGGAGLGVSPPDHEVPSTGGTSRGLRGQAGQQIATSVQRPLLDRAFPVADQLRGFGQ